MNRANLDKTAINKDFLKFLGSNGAKPQLSQYFDGRKISCTGEVKQKTVLMPRSTGSWSSNQLRELPGRQTSADIKAIDEKFGSSLRTTEAVDKNSVEKLSEDYNDALRELKKISGNSDLLEEISDKAEKKIAELVDNASWVTELQPSQQCNSLELDKVKLLLADCRSFISKNRIAKSESKLQTASDDAPVNRYYQDKPIQQSVASLSSNSSNTLAEPRGVKNAVF